MVGLENIIFETSAKHLTKKYKRSHILHKNFPEFFKTYGLRNMISMTKVKHLT